MKKIVRLRPFWLTVLVTLFLMMASTTVAQAGTLESIFALFLGKSPEAADQGSINPLDKDFVDAYYTGDKNSHPSEAGFQEASYSGEFYYRSDYLEAYGADTRILDDVFNEGYLDGKRYGVQEYQGNLGIHTAGQSLTGTYYGYEKYPSKMVIYENYFDFWEHPDAEPVRVYFVCMNDFMIFRISDGILGVGTAYHYASDDNRPSELYVLACEAGGIAEIWLTMTKE